MASFRVIQKYNSLYYVQFRSILGFWRDHTVPDGWISGSTIPSFNTFQEAEQRVWELQETYSKHKHKVIKEF